MSKGKQFYIADAPTAMPPQPHACFNETGKTTSSSTNTLADEQTILRVTNSEYLRLGSWQCFLRTHGHEKRRRLGKGAETVAAMRSHQKKRYFDDRTPLFSTLFSVSIHKVGKAITTDWNGGISFGPHYASDNGM